MEEKEIMRSTLVETNQQIPKRIIIIGVVVLIFGLLAWHGYELENIPWVILGLLIIGVGKYLLLYVGNCELVVTNKRVYGKAAFDRQVDLPIDSITAVSTSYFDTVSVSTSSGRVSFVMLSNKTEIIGAIRELIINRQNSHIYVDSEHETNREQDDIEMLKKYKQLFEEGTITEEEFNAKKKQLLNL